MAAAAGAGVSRRSRRDGRGGRGRAVARARPRHARSGPPLSVPVAFVALDRAVDEALRVPPPGGRQDARSRGLDFGRNAAVAIFSQFGCMDHRVAVTSIAQRGGTLVVSLVERPLAPGTMECQAIYPTYRLLAVPKASLARSVSRRGPTLGSARAEPASRPRSARSSGGVRVTHLPPLMRSSLTRETVTCL